MAPEVLIVDTSVFISGLIGSDSQAPPARILDGMLTGRLVYLLSHELLGEYSAVLRRPSLIKPHRLSSPELDRLLTLVVANAMWRAPVPADKAPDAGDQHLWALLASFPEAQLITGDKLLLDNPPSGASVVSPREFVEAHFSGN